MEERSAGAVVYMDTVPAGRAYLLLLNAGHWDFPKGNREEGETELQTVLREVAEETGLTGISIVPGFRRVIEYYYRRSGKNVHKQVVYLLARTRVGEIRISKEHQGFGWFRYDEAVQRASFDNSKSILADAEEFVGKLLGSEPEGP
jgi:8-oxo-dGTP pyrophosphatase MutT (NUDIX family)